MSKKTVKIENKEIIFGDGSKSKYGNLIKSCIESASSDGLTIGQMRNRFEIVDRIEKEFEKKEIIIDYNDYEKIVEMVRKMRWAINNRKLVEFENYLKKML